jgi:hypothetical protein
MSIEIDSARYGKCLHNALASSKPSRRRTICTASATPASCRPCSCAGVFLNREQANAVKACLLKAYRLQYLVSGARIERFQRALASKVTAQQMQRIAAAYAPLIAYVGIGG